MPINRAWTLPEGAKYYLIHLLLLEPETNMLKPRTRHRRGPALTYPASTLTLSGTGTPFFWASGKLRVKVVPT